MHFGLWSQTKLNTWVPTSMWLGCIGIDKDVIDVMSIIPRRRPAMFTKSGVLREQLNEGCFALPSCSQASCGFEVCEWEEAEKSEQSK